MDHYKTNKKRRLTSLLSFCLLVALSACSSVSTSDAPNTDAVANETKDESQNASNEPSVNTSNTTDTTDTTDADNATSGSEPNSLDQSTDQQSDNEMSGMLGEDAYPADRAEMALTWNASLVTFPDGAGGVINSSISELETGLMASSESLPVAVYLHGCDGFWSATNYRMNWLSSQGYVTIAPNSFARTFYPESCNIVSRTGWQYKPTIAMRQFDVGYALEQVRKFTWADQQNIILYGFSEGAVVSATFNSADPQHAVSARLLEGWSCVSIPWTEYHGILAPESEPVLTLFADQDPWLQGAELPISCANFISQSNGSQSILVDYAPLRTSHTLLEDSTIQEIVLNFLLQQQSPPIGR